MACLAAVTAAAGPARAGAVETFAGRLEGPVTLENGRIEVGGRAVAWSEVLYVLRGPSSSTFEPPDAVRFAGGERWGGELLSLEGGTIRFRSRLVGERELPAGTVTMLEFEPGLPEPAGPLAPGLYRPQGPPVPGTLLWIDARRIAIDSLLGVLKLPRETAERYVFARPASAAPPAGSDEVGLVDGSVMRGRFGFDADGPRLEHPVLGTVRIPPAMVVWLVRRPPTAVYLADAEPEVERAAGVVGGSPRPETIRRRPGSRPGPGAEPFIAAVRLEPHTEVRYGLTLTGRRRLVALVRPVRGARGQARLRVEAGDAVLEEVVVAPGDAAVRLSLALPPRASDVRFDVTFGEGIALPCGVVIADPLVVVDAS